MDLTKTPGVTFYELNSNPTFDSTQYKIPVIIGPTASAVATPKVMTKFKSYAEANRTVANGGIIPNDDSTTANPMLEFLKDFFEEAQPTDTNAIGVPYVYVIDLGKAPQTADYTTAMDTAKTKEDITVEAYTGIYDPAVMNDADTSMSEDVHTGNPRIALFPAGVSGVSDADMIKLTDEKQKTTEGAANFVQKSRVFLIEPDFYAKTVARICVTPYYEEPGYNIYNTIEAGNFREREVEEEQALQAAGIIFNRDETTLENVYPKINLAVSSAFAKGDLRPNDALMHARVNADHLIRKIFVACYPQIKRNEYKKNLKILKTAIDKVVDDEITAENMEKGTKVTVEESDKNPYQIKVSGKALPINSTLYIGFGMYVGETQLKIIDGEI